MTQEELFDDVSEITKYSLLIADIILLITFVVVAKLSYERGYYESIYDICKSGESFRMEKLSRDVYSCKSQTNDYGGSDEIRLFKPVS